MPLADRTDADFLTEVFAAFDEAARASGDEVDLLRVAGRPLHVRWAAPTLRDRFRPALRHLVTEGPAGAGTTVCCWDGAASPVALPPPPWPRSAFLGQSRVLGHVVGPLVVTYDADGRLLQLYDRVGDRALLHVADGGRLPAWHDRAPFKALLQLWADDQGLALLHAATLVVDGVAVVLAGRSGDGKSTTALTGLAAGLDLLGDDACLVDVGRRRVFSVYGRAKLERDAWQRLRARGVPLEGAEVDGALVLTPPVRANAVLGRVAVLSVDPSGTTSVSAPLGHDEALSLLVRTVRVESQGSTPASLAALRRLVQAVPVRRLRLGQDPEQVLDAVRELAVTS